MGEWFPLPSGKMVCHQSAYMYHEAARLECEKVGGYLAEVTNRDDMQTLLYIMWSGLSSGEKSTSRFRIGAVPRNSQWRLVYINRKQTILYTVYIDGKSLVILLILELAEY